MYPVREAGLATTAGGAGGAILPSMPESLDQEWRRLTAHYAEMWDDELLNLAADYNDLTDMAKQVPATSCASAASAIPRTLQLSSERLKDGLQRSPKNYDILAGPLVHSRHRA